MSTIENVEKMHAAYPETFRIPDREARNGLHIGMFAKLIFEGSERMWVRVTHREYIGGVLCYRGSLANHPVVVTDEWQYGDEVGFGPEHVCAIEAAWTER